MSTQFKFITISEPVNDIITSDEISTGYKLLIPFEEFAKYNFSTKINLYSPTCDFLKTPLLLHAWTINKNGKIVKKETHINSIEWGYAMNFKQTSSLYWPDIQENDIQDFKYDILFVVQPLIDIEIHELVLEFESIS
jgi:hypothetical protein